MKKISLMIIVGLCYVGCKTKDISNKNINDCNCKQLLTDYAYIEFMVKNSPYIGPSTESISTFELDYSVRRFENCFDTSFKKASASCYYLRSNDLKFIEEKLSRKCAKEYKRIAKYRKRFEGLVFKTSDELIIEKIDSIPK